MAGVSLGAGIAAKLLEAWPERLLTATLVGAAGGRESDFLPGLTLADSIEQGKGLGPLFFALTPPGQPQPTEAQIEKFNASFYATNDPKAIVAYMRGYKGLIVDFGKMAARKVPAHAVIGELDPLKAGVDALAQAMPSLKVTVLERTGHAYYGTAYLSAVKNFLDVHRAADRP